MTTTKTILGPNGSYTVREEIETDDPLEAVVDTLRRARMLSDSMIKERPYLKPKERQRLPNNWQLDLQDEILDRGIRR